MRNRSPLLFVWSLAVVLVAVAGGGARAADPDLGTVDDMLNQRWVTNPVDDLVAANPVLDSNPDRFSAFNYWFYTQDNQITTQLPTQTVVSLNCFRSSPLPQQTRVGRLFAFKNDVIVTVTPAAGDCGIFQVQVTDPVSGASTLLGVQGSTNRWLQVAVADFNYDGYDEVVVFNTNTGTGITTLSVITAVDVTDLSKGLTVVSTLDVGRFKSAMSQPVVGDFDNDGVPEVAWVGAPGPGGSFNVAGTIKVYFASVCLLPNPACSATALSLRPTVIGLGTSQSGEYCRSQSALAAGDFFPSPSGGTTLALAFSTTGKSGDPPRCRADLYSFAFDANLTPQQRDKKDNVFAPNENVRDNVQLFAAAARFNWFEPQEQAVVAMSGYDRFCQRGGPFQADPCATIIYFARRWIGVLSFDANGAITIHLSETRDDHRTEELWGLAVGRFNDVTDDVSQYTPRIALLRAERANRPNDDDKHQADILLYAVKDPGAGDFTPQGYAEPKINNWRELTFEQAFGNNLLQAGDLQGRSMRLGAPLVVRIPNHLQPRLILSVPPMHVDYVQLPGASEPAVVNFSVTPATFFASYNTAETNSTQSSTTETTSYSWALGESVQANFKASIPFVQGISGSNQESWGQTYDREVATTYDTLSSFEFDASGSTSFSDVVWFNKEDFNVYYYPVLGETVCPQDKPNCTAAERRPLYVVTSGPSNSTDYQIEGSNLEWYQPVHEPGNIFYPWNETQLTGELDDEPILLSRGTAFATDDHPASYAALWANGQGAEKTAGTTTTHSFASSTSVTLGTPSLDDAAAGANVTLGFDYNNSNSVSTLNTRLTAVGESTGVAGEKPGTFRDPSLYQYLFQPFIFGQHLPAGTVQNIEPNVDIATHGMLQTQYVADPVNIVAPGAWWATSPYTQYIDIALNHPRLWVVSEDNQAGTLPPECLPGPQCVTGRVPDPDNLWTSQFYWLRGLFVTINGINGPQRAQATAGDTVFLQARVYNYSLTAMPADSAVHAAFYRQEWDTRLNRPIGDSVLIEEVEITNANGEHVIPPFKSGSVDVHGHELPNWVLASTSFDSTGLGGRHFLFWVVVWAQDRGGTLIGELPGHGLTAKPGTLKAIGEVPLESATVTYESTGQTVTTSFSNNVGFWKQAFYVAPQTEASAPSGGILAKLQLQELQVRPAKVRPNQTVVVSALVEAKGAKAEGVVVAVVDETRKKVVDLDLLAHIDANGRHHVAIPYETSGCGLHKLRLLVEPGTKRQRKSSTSFTVECETKQ